MALACGDGDEDEDPFAPLTADPAFPGTPGDAATYAGLFQFEPLPGCAVRNATDLNGATELRLFRGSGVTDADVREFVSGLQRYYAQYGVAMSTRHATLAVPLAQALILDTGTLTARVKAETGIDINSALTPEEEDRATAAAGAAMLWNVKELLRVYGEPRRDGVNVVLLEDMVGAVSPEFGQLRNVAGLGLSPELLAKAPASDPSRQLYDWLDVSVDFTPIAVVGTNVVREKFGTPDVVVAHEVGHAYGLIHVPGSGTNLMNPSASGCSPPLDDGQLDEVAAATRAIAHGELGAESVSLTTRAGDFVTAVHRFVATRAGAER